MCDCSIPEMNRMNKIWLATIYYTNSLLLVNESESLKREIKKKRG